MKLPLNRKTLLSKFNNDETQRGLSVSTSKECGAHGPHSLHISILICQGINVCKAIGVKTAAAAIRNNFIQRKHSGWSEDRSLSVHNDKIAFAARLNRQLMQAADHGDTEKSFLYLDL